METVLHILEFIQQQPLGLGLLILMLSASIEYVFPPFPGDSVTLVGAVLVPTVGWPWWAVLVAVVVGSVAGAMVDWYLGAWLTKTADRDTWIHRWFRRPKVAPKIEEIKGHFRRRGPVYIAANRFLPAFRSLFFVAAGLAELRAASVAFWAFVSATLWNGGILVLGIVVGYNLDELVGFVQAYTRIVLAGVLIAMICAGFWRHWRRRQGEAE